MNKRIDEIDKELDKLIYEKKRMKTLSKELRKASDSYYNDGISLMSDKEFDMQFKELEELEKKFPEDIQEDSPTRNVGSKTKSTFEKVQHEFPMLSLDNTYNKGDIEAFTRRVDKLTKRATYVTEPKFDGVSISLTYRNNKLVQALTRGNGVIGDDVTENVKMISDIPKTLDYGPGKLDITVRGEILMSRTVFKELNDRRMRDNKPQYMNPRNTVAGTLALHDVNEVKNRKLESRMYYIVNEVSGLTDQANVLIFLKAIGFNVGKCTANLTSASDIITAIEKFDKTRDKMDVDTDGVVIKVSELDKWDEIGLTGRAPRYAIAYKFDTEKVTTILREVLWQVGRTGKLTPVAVFDPVNLAGTAVNRSTLHNLNMIREKDLMIGDTILVEKAAEIIPQVIAPLAYLRTGKEIFIKEPKECPVCGSTVESRDGSIDVYCTNWECKSRLSQRIEHYVSRDAVNIMFFGPALINSLVDEGILTKVSDIYKLIEKYKGTAFPVERKVGTAIDESRDNDPTRVLYGLGIHTIGRRASKKLMEHFKSIDAILSADEIELENIVGKASAKNIKEWASSKRNIEMFKDIKSYSVRTRLTSAETPETINGKLSGKTFVLTGTMDIMGTKGAITKTINDLGGEVSSSLSKKTDYLIVGSNGGGKKAKAEKLGVKCITEAEFAQNIIGEWTI